jgi:hypothetical protein
MAACDNKGGSSGGGSGMGGPSGAGGSGDTGPSGTPGGPAGGVARAAAPAEAHRADGKFPGLTQNTVASAVRPELSKPVLSGVEGGERRRQLAAHASIPQHERPVA